LPMVISISPMNDLIECGINLISSTNSDPESLRPIFAEIGKWLRAYFVGTTSSRVCRPWLLPCLRCPGVISPDSKHNVSGARVRREHAPAASQYGPLSDGGTIGLRRLPADRLKLPHVRRVVPISPPQAVRLAAGLVGATWNAEL
jgi:hypothetical protein